MGDDELSKEGEIIPKGELPPWLGPIVEKWIAADLEKLRLSIEAEERSEKRDDRFAWVLLIFTLGAIAALYSAGQRSDAIAVATHALAFFFGVGLAAIRGLKSSAE